MPLEFDPFDPDVLDDPYPHYRRLRSEAPCYKLRDKEVWVVSRFEDVNAVLRNYATFSSVGGIGIEWTQRPLMGMYDPPQHTRLRRLVQPHFTPKAVAGLKPKIEARVTKLVDALVEKGTGDLADDLAVPVAVGTIGDILGMPEDRYDDLKRWGDGVIDELPGGQTPEQHEHTEVLRREFVDFLNELVQKRREQPGPGGDIISLLVNAKDADAMTHKELIAFCVLLLVAGFETTSHAITNGVMALIENPDQCRLLVSNPALVPSLVEEVIRYDSSIQSFFRNTVKDTEVCGVSIPKGSKVMVLYGSANRDERQFPDPDRFLIERNAEHIGFGVGIHHCLGAPVARLTMSTVAEVMLKRVGSIALNGTATRTQNITFRGYSVMPVRVTPRT